MKSILHPWGCKVRVHDTSGSKLDGRSSIGHWMGFDAETKEGHRIYWAERCTVSMERSVKFNVEPNDVVVGVLPLKGEDKPDNEERVDKRLTTIESGGQHVDNEAPDVEAPLPAPETIHEDIGGRGKHIHKETEYVRMLKDRSGVTGSRGGGHSPGAWGPVPLL